MSRTVTLSLSCQAGCDNGMTTCCTSQVGACMLLKNGGLAPCQHAPMRALMYVAQYPHRFWRETIWGKTCCCPPAAYDAELKHNRSTLTPQAHAHHFNAQAALPRPTAHRERMRTGSDGARYCCTNQPMTVLMVEPMSFLTPSTPLMRGASGLAGGAGAAVVAGDLVVAGAAVVAGGAVEGRATGVPGLWLGQARLRTK